MPSPRQLHGAATRVLSSMMIVIGVALLVSTFARGGGPQAVGVVFGVVFAAAGVARLWLHTRSRHD